MLCLAECVGKTLASIVRRKAPSLVQLCCIEHFAFLQLGKAKLYLPTCANIPKKPATKKASTVI